MSPIDALQVINGLNDAVGMSSRRSPRNGPQLRVTGGDQLVPPDTPDGKTRISYLDEPFAGYSPGFFGVRYVKCHILTSDPGTVYFQDSWKYPFHYDFARERLAPFLNMTREQFDAVSLRQSGQQVVLGTVLMSPDGRELAVQLVGYDAYPRAGGRVDRQHCGFGAERYGAHRTLHADFRTDGGSGGGPQLVCRTRHHGGRSVAPGFPGMSSTRKGGRPAVSSACRRTRSARRTATAGSGPATSCC